MKTELLTLLKNSQNYLSGQELCETFGVSRTAIWKVMNQLKEEGYVIEAIQNKGYRLIHCPDIVSKTEIESHISTSWAGRNVVFEKEIDSTNSLAKKVAEEGQKHGTLVVADCQTAGRGRRGRNWVSPSGEGIWMSLIVKPSFSPLVSSMITLVAALSVSKAIKEVTGLTNEIKWPNDIVVNKKKVCGILTEMNAEIDFVHYLIVGIGMNVNMTEFSEELMHTATSLRLEKGSSIIRSDLICKVMEYFEYYYDIFIQTNDLSQLKEEYNNILVNINNEVRIINGEQSFQGIALGINNTGELLVTKEDGQVVEVMSGEVSVRGVYGYV